MLYGIANVERLTQKLFSGQEMQQKKKKKTLHK